MAKKVAEQERRRWHKCPHCGVVMGCQHTPNTPPNRDHECVQKYGGCGWRAPHFEWGQGVHVESTAKPSIILGSSLGLSP